MASEVDAFVENSKFEKRKSKNIKSARSLSSMLNKSRILKKKEKSKKKEFRLLRKALETLDS